MARQPPIADVAASASDDGDSGGSHKATEQEEQEQPEERDNGGEPALSSVSKRKRKPSKHAVKELEAAGLEAAWFAEDAENDALVSNLKAWCEALGLSNEGTKATLSARLCDGLVSRDGLTNGGPASKKVQIEASATMSETASAEGGLAQG